MKLNICFSKLEIMSELVLKKNLLDHLNLMILTLKLFTKSFVDMIEFVPPFDAKFSRNR